MSEQRKGRGFGSLTKGERITSLSMMRLGDVDADDVNKPHSIGPRDEMCLWDFELASDMVWRAVKVAPELVPTPLFD